MVLGEAGRGKSRLVGEALAGVPAEDVRVVIGESPMGGGHGSYQIWSPVLRGLLQGRSAQGGPDAAGIASAGRQRFRLTTKSASPTSESLAGESGNTANSSRAD